MLVLVLVRGLRNVRTPVKDALKQLGLTRRYHAVLVEDTPNVQGILNKAQHLLAWGPANEKTVSSLKQKGDAPFRLHAPKNGLPPVKHRYPNGAYGNWNDQINALVEGMVA